MKDRRLRNAVRGFALVGGALLLTTHLYVQLFVPPGGVLVWKEVMVQEGAAFRGVAQRLEQEGLIRGSGFFIVLARWSGVTHLMRPGIYALNPRMNALEVLRIFQEGRIAQVPVLIPEGATARQVASILETKGFGEREAFLRLMGDSAFIGSLGLPKKARSLEGFLFPDTYYIPKGYSPGQILKMLVTWYRKAFSGPYRHRAEAMGLSELEVVTLASLIERETASEAERALVSAVFHNRLRLGMPLQSDPTVIYALDEQGVFDGNLTRRHLRIPSPYNTYRHRGLPPGPIGNPSAASIHAALYPADVDYLYFVSKNNGTHHFSSSLSEHNHAVHQYQVVGRRGLRTKDEGR